MALHHKSVIPLLLILSMPTGRSPNQGTGTATGTADQTAEEPEPSTVATETASDGSNQDATRW